MRGLLLCFALGLASGVARGDQLVVPAGSTWRYLDDGSFPGSSWTAAEFDDSAWRQGPAELGYGEGDEQTLTGYGPSASQKYLTTYFRRAFTPPPGIQVTGLQLDLLCDDGAAVYLNGTELVRVNLPAGALASSTRASGSSTDGQWLQFEVTAAALRPDQNVLAVEVHQVSPSSSDVSFDLELSASGLELVRGPYLQSVGTTRAVVRFATSTPAAGAVRFARAPEPPSTLVQGLATTEHEITLTGLRPGTSYAYQIEVGGAPLLGSDGTLRFGTAPARASHQRVRILAMGDGGILPSLTRGAFNAYRAHTGADPDLLLWLGDAARTSDAAPPDPDALFEQLGEPIRSLPIWPAFSEADAATSSTSTQTGPFFTRFTLPRLGELGGVASFTEAYYSFDWGNVHFVVLDSAETTLTSSSPMWTWLAADLAGTEQDWRIAVFHHPPYAKADVNSDSSTQAQGRMRSMRLQALPLLEAAGIDLVISGYARTYQRSALLDSHYGTSGTLTQAMVLDPGEGSGGTEDVYRKGVGSPAHDGAVYALSGSATAVGSGSFTHPALVAGAAAAGVLAVEVLGTRLDGRFIRSDGQVLDRFTLVKGTQTDSDADAIDDTADNCPWLANPTQLDQWDVDSPGSDGVGDLCECGDLNQDGPVDLDDLTLLREHLTGERALTPAQIAACDLRPPGGSCGLRELVLLRRSVLHAARAPTHCSRGGRPDPYGGLHPFTGDGHIHSATAWDWITIADPSHDPNVYCAHAYKSPTEVYDLCRANGLDFCSISHHSNAIDTPSGISWWIDPANPDRLGIGTDPAGFPLPDGGFTPSELVYLQAWARQRNAPGSFVALYGIEYTVDPPVNARCLALGPGGERCGGHKIAVCPRSGVGRRCNPNDANCDREAELYQYLRDFDCVGSAAHPNGQIPQDFNPLDAAGDGFDPVAIMNYEFVPSAENDGQVVVGAPTGWNAVLQSGVRLGVVFGSDTHNRPAVCGNSLQPGTGGRRMVCWADSLTRSGIVGALRARRCYHVEAAARPTVRFSIEDRPMGSELARAELSDPDRVRIRIETSGEGLLSTQSFDRFEVIHDGVAALSGPCGASSRCTVDTSLSVGDPRGYWYLRLLHGTSMVMSVSSPIWID